jgi:predicted nucleotidyltransferase
MNFESSEAQSVSELRRGIVEESVRSLKMAGELENISEVILFGSTARGDARQDSDIDIFCVTKDGRPMSSDEVSLISQTIRAAQPEVEVQMASGDKSTAMRFVSVRSSRHPETEPTWLTYDFEDTINESSQ